MAILIKDVVIVQLVICLYFELVAWLKQYSSQTRERWQHGIKVCDSGRKKTELLFNLSRIAFE
jgi:hypothetical protein